MINLGPIDFYLGLLLNITFLSFRFLRAWSQNHHQVVRTCPGHHHQPIAQNRGFKIERPEPPPLIHPISTRFLIFGD